MAWPARHHCNPDVARELTPGAGHQHCRPFLPHVGQVDVRTNRGVKNLHYVITGKSEYLMHSGAVEGAGDDIGAS